MSDLVHIDQSHKVLQLGLIQGEVDLGPLHILQEKQIEVSKIPVRFGVLGASHFVELLYGDTHFFEVFSCANVNELTTKSSETIIRDLKDLEASRTLSERFDSFSYSIVTEVVTGERGIDRLNELRLLYDTNPTQTCLYDFPTQDTENYVYSPTTIIHISNISDDIEIESVHTYPNEDIMVFTKSTINIKK